jgi:hypothetical protein
MVIMVALVEVVALVELPDLEYLSPSLILDEAFYFH